MSMDDNIKKMIDNVYAVLPFVKITTINIDIMHEIVIRCDWYFRGEELHYQFPVPTGYDVDDRFYTEMTSILLHRITSCIQEYLI